MTAATMLRRLAKLEATVMPKPQKPLLILFQPSDDDPAAWAAHEADMAEAQERDERFCVVRSPGVNRGPVEGVQYFDSDLEAELAALGPEGVHELRDSVLGDIFGVASGAASAQGDGD